jgi:putative hydrolase
MGAMSASGGPFGFDPRMFEQVPLFRELAKVMSWQGGPVNWDLAGQTATALGTEGDAASTGVGHAFGDAVATAEHWLDAVTSLAAVDGPAEALTPSQWIAEAVTSQGLGAYIEPMAAGAADALGEQLPEELRQLGAGAGGDDAMRQAMSSLGAMLYGMQAGVIGGHLAQQLWSCYDLGVPTIDARRVGPVGTALDHFAGDYDLDVAEVRHWLALSEAVHRRMFAGVSWLSDEVASLVREFAAAADFDPQSLMDSLGGGLDPSDPQALQQALESSDAFAIEPTTAQRRVLDRLQALVSFTEAYADTVVRSAATERLPSLARIEEARQRRRVEHGPGERFLAQLVGLDLTPADLRTAQAFCDAVIEARQQEGLDRVWQDPACLPDLDELSDPSQWLVRMAARELGVGDDG